MRIFIGSSGEQRRLVEWLTGFIRREYRDIEPVPWISPWTSGNFTLENIQEFIRNTDASILFWTPDDLTQYRGTTRYEPRDNLLLEAGMFISGHGRERTQLLIPSLPSSDPRGKVAVPTDILGLTWNEYPWVEGAQPETTGLPTVARRVCEYLLSLGPRVRTPFRLKHLAGLVGIEEVQTFVGACNTINVQGIIKLATEPTSRSIDILASYRVGEIRRVLDNFRRRPDSSLRACFANMWDTELAEAYRRKYHDRSLEHMQHALKESIGYLLGPCDIEPKNKDDITVTNISAPPVASYDLRLTLQRITFGYYRIDNVAFITPLDIKRAQNPAPLAWVLDRETVPGVFDFYLNEFSGMFEDAQVVYRNR
ncbi:MAG: TIR domain-containing protein [Chitinophagaceae bacterium]